MISDESDKEEMRKKNANKRKKFMIGDESDKEMRKNEKRERKKKAGDGVYTQPLPASLLQGR